MVEILELGTTMVYREETTIVMLKTVYLIVINLLPPIMHLMQAMDHTTLHQQTGETIMEVHTVILSGVDMEDGVKHEIVFLLCENRIVTINMCFNTSIFKLLNFLELDLGTDMAKYLVQ